MTKYLSKSSFMAGRDCKRKLWQLLWDRKSASPPDGMAQLNMEFGKRFGVLAHSLYPNGVLIDIDIYNLEKAVEDTRQAINSGSPVILEATFCHDNYRVLSDIVEKLPDGSWHLIEVKSSTKVKDVHYPDLAYQKWVMEKNGYHVSKCSVIHADTSGVWPDLNSIFKIEDITESVNKEYPSIDNELEWMAAFLKEGVAAPDAEDCYSKQCLKCQFKKVCWEGIDDITIYDVINVRKLADLKDLGVLYIKDVPDDFNLSPTEKVHVGRIKEKSIDIDRKAITNKLSKLTYPIYFLDFESISVPCPLFDGNRPWEKLAFQYSLHILDDTDSEPKHIEFLHKESSDPSAYITEGLITDIGDKGSIVVYWAGMEKGVLKSLKDKFPEHSSRLQSMIDRLWDLELIFKKDYRHWEFGTKSSIKVVLPKLLPNSPELSYKSQVIQEGGAASKAWIDLIETDDADLKNKTSDDLKEYCKLDTLAMVELLKLLQA